MTRAEQALTLLLQFDGKPITIRDYLVNLLLALWKEGEGFSGKRPFGNSGWEYDLYVPLVRAGLVDGQFDEQFPNCLESVDVTKADRIIREAIELLR